MRNIIKAITICVLGAVVFAAVYVGLRVTFELRGLEFVTDENCLLRLSYSANRSATVRLTTLDNQLLSEAQLPPGTGYVDLTIAENRDTPQSAVLLTIEQDGKLIWSGGFHAPAVQIRLTSIAEWGWDPDAGQCNIRAVAVQIGNSGGLPAYVSKVVGLIDGRLIGGTPSEWSPAGGGRLERWILPGTEENLIVEWSGPSFSRGYHGFRLIAEDAKGGEIASMQFPSIINVPSEYPHDSKMAEDWKGSVEAPAGWYRSENWRVGWP